MKRGIFQLLLVVCFTALLVEGKKKKEEARPKKEAKRKQFTMEEVVVTDEDVADDVPVPHLGMLVTFNEEWQKIYCMENDDQDRIGYCNAAKNKEMVFEKMVGHKMNFLKHAGIAASVSQTAKNKRTDEKQDRQIEVKVESLEDKCRAGNFFLRQREIAAIDKVTYDEVQFWTMDRAQSDKQYDIDEL